MFWRELTISAASRHFTSFAASGNNVGRKEGHLFRNVLVLESIAEIFAEFSMQFWVPCFEKDVKHLEKIGETNRNGQRSRKSVLKKIWLNCTLTASKRNYASFHNCAEILQPESVGGMLRYEFRLCENQKYENLPSSKHSEPLGLSSEGFLGQVRQASVKSNMEKTGSALGHKDWASGFCFSLLFLNLVL